MAEFIAPIESDLGLVGQVLRFVNSSYFGFSREVASVKQAVTLVGMRTIKKLCPVERGVAPRYSIPSAGGFS